MSRLNNDCHFQLIIWWNSFSIGIFIITHLCFHSTWMIGFSTWIIQVSQPSSGTCRRTSLRRWQRAAAWTGSAFLCRRHWVHHFRIVHDQEYVHYWRRMIFHKPKHLIVSEYKLRRSLMNGQPLFGQPLYGKHII